MDYERLSLFLRAMCGKQNSKIRYPNLWLKGGEIGAQREEGTTVEVYCILNFHFKVTEIPDWLATCQSFNKKSQSSRSPISTVVKTFAEHSEQTRVENCTLVFKTSLCFCGTWNIFSTKYNLFCTLKIPIHDCQRSMANSTILWCILAFFALLLAYFEEPPFFRSVWDSLQHHHCNT